jgi:hypothetical protein
MTEAERKRRQRAGLATKRASPFRDNVPKPDRGDEEIARQEIARLKARIAELEQEKYTAQEIGIYALLVAYCQAITESRDDSIEFAMRHKTPFRDC